MLVSWPERTEYPNGECCKSESYGAVSSQVSAQLTGDYILSSLRLPQPLSLPLFSTGEKQWHLRTKSYYKKICDPETWLDMWITSKVFKNLLYLGPSSGEVSWIREWILCIRTFNLSPRLRSCVVKVNVYCIELCYYFGLTRTSGTYAESNTYPLFYT